MSNYQQTLDINASPAMVYAALTTPEGLRGWWTQDCDVPAEVGSTIHFRFDRTYKDMRIDRLQPGREVRWHCTRAHIAVGELSRRDEWVGTDIVFRLTPAGEGRTRVDFEHMGLVPALDCYGLCSNGWRYFMSSLQQFVETGCGTPYALKAVAA